MHKLLTVATLAIVSSTISSQYAPPTQQDIPSFNIHLDHKPEDRFVEVATAMKPQALKMIGDYMHLAPRVVQNFFKSEEDIIKLRHMEYFREVVGMAQVLELDTSILFMLNYAFELGDALCTSIVARQPDGTIIHGRNMDFAFADAVRNATYLARFHRNGKLLYESVMFAGYVGVASASRPGAYSMTLNARDVHKDVENFFKIMGDIFIGQGEIGMVTRDVVQSCEDYACLLNTIPSLKTIVPMYFIIAGTGVNEGVVISKGYDSADNIRFIDEENWYLVQTNDDHFAGVCQTRCQDANAHMQAIGEANISLDTLLNDVILQAHNLNRFTIYTTMAKPVEKYFKVYGFNSEIPYVK